MVLVLFSLLMAGANALFWNNSRSMLHGRKMVDATRIGQNCMENLRAADWQEIGAWIARPREESVGGFRVVRSAANVEWSGTEFRPSGSDTGYRQVTVSVYPPEEAGRKPFRWVRLCVRP